MIVLDRLTKSFGAKQVLRGVSLEIPDGQNTVMIGASGSGKSVTLKLIVGLIEPDAGAVLVDGDVVHDLDRHGLMELRGRIGYVFQFAALFDSMTVAENIRLGLVKRGLDDAEIRLRTAESLAVVELPGVEDKYPAELSGGMRKRVGIARAIALQPRYILYDEPTTGLDPVTSAVMDQLMIRTRDLGVTGLSPEAELAVTAFRAVEDGIADALHACASGRELVAGGFAEDVAMAAGLDASDVVPLLAGGAFTDAP